ncbi:MAG: CCA tRNA nucleotidyltransferase [Eubacteriales bacterium]|nr:CCA tRNA nucleotidyltransferase [Eubacteriales bacterium]
MNHIQIPAFVRSILRRMEDAGYLAYLVGGCVRDMQLMRGPGDWDICTNAQPEETLALFPASVPSGLQHGTVTVKLDGGHAEVTTFRTEGGYADHRRPDSVRFVPDLETDLSRRDFTVNAMALSLSGRLIDPFDGLGDLKRQVIRCVGNPAERFSEDALRMLRAFRFCAQLGFRLDAAAADAITELAPTAAFLASERIRDELEKILLSPCPSMAGDVLRCGLLSSFASVSPGIPSLQNLHTLPAERSVRWAGFTAQLLNNANIRDALDFLTALRLDRRTADSCAQGASFACSGDTSSPLEQKRLIARCGPDTALCFGAAREALGIPGGLDAISALLRSGDCLSLRELAVNGGDLLARGLRGEQIGETLHLLLDHVLIHPEQNRKDLLLSYLDRKSVKP